MRTLCLVFCLAATACGAKKPRPARDLDKCELPADSSRVDGKGLPEGIGDVFAVGDTPYATFTQLEGDHPGHCTFEDGPIVKNGIVTGEGTFFGQCGSARTEYLARSVKRVAVSSPGPSISGLGLVTNVSLKVGDKINLAAVRFDVCDRYLRHEAGPSTTHWKLAPSCASIARAVPMEEIVKPVPVEGAVTSDFLQLEATGAGSCEIVLEASGVSTKLPVTVQLH